MLAVAIAAAISRALSYGTMYTTKLLRRGTDIDRPAPWRALRELRVADAMHPFTAPLTMARPDGAAPEPGPDGVSLPGPVTYRRDPQALFAGESLAQALRQLVVYGRDGLPVLSADGQQIQGWVTNNRVLQTVAREVHTSQAQTRQAQLAAEWAWADPQAALREPSTPLPGYQILEITVPDRSPAVGQRLGRMTWPRGTVPASILHNRRLRDPDPGITVNPGDRIILLTSRPDQPPVHTGSRAADTGRATPL
ncbi:MAG: TrkA C-terminal domain-containing protein [Micromonosporaceae bacterium]